MFFSDTVSVNGNVFAVSKLPAIVTMWFKRQTYQSEKS